MILARFWQRLPVVVRAVVLGGVVNAVGQTPSAALSSANLRFWPAVAWSLPLVVLWLWFFWQYMGGRWWPPSTAKARSEHLAARPLSPRVWRWALVAGGLGMAAIVALHIVLSPITPPTYSVYYAVFAQLPFPTLVALVITISLVAGIVEEAAFRGYMHGMIERRHGPVAAIAVTTFFFVLIHFGGLQPMSAPRTLLIAVVSVMYGALRYLTGSILPGVILHSAGDAYSILLLWFYWVHGAMEGRLIGFGAASRQPLFWLNVAELLIFASASVWAFRRLRRPSNPVSENMAG